MVVSLVLVAPSSAGAAEPGGAGFGLDGLSVMENVLPVPGPGGSFAATS